jgi:uncharacterized protein YdeI (YjbR/CyaY-like superfamily)
MPEPKPLFFATPAVFRRWLRANRSKGDELWVGYYKRHTGRPSLTWPESVDEALCFGWIDGIRRSLDADSYMIRFTPRRSRSQWSDVNIVRAQALIAEGRMQPAGLRAFEARPARETGYSYERAKASLTPEDEQTFRRAKRAWSWFQSRPPGYRRTVAHWVASAKKPETRAKRLRELIAHCEAQQAIPAMQRPVSKKRT